MEGMTRTSGFTLLEVIIVAAVIGVVASMVIPGFQNAKKAANESGCIGTMRSLMSATETYTLRYGSYPVQMQDLADVDIIDEVLGASSALPGKSGYVYTLTSTTGTWSCTADPITHGITGDRYFYIDSTGVVRSNGSQTATSADQAVE